MTSTHDNRTAGVVNRAPLAGRYPTGVALALLGLCPFIVLTTAFTLVEKDVVADLHGTLFLGQLSNALANAAYAFGAVTAADLVLRLPQRWLYIGCEAVFVAGSLLAMLAPGMAVFTLGRVLQGMTTGMMLVVALPPLITNYGSDKLPLSALFVNLGLFGMVTLGPVAGGLAAGFHGWRPLFAAIAVLGVAGLLTGLLGYGPNEPPAPRIGFDATAVPLALGGTFLPFFAVSWLTEGGFGSVGFLAPLLIGLALLVALIALQFFKSRALMPVRPISHTLPVVGIGTAMIGTPMIGITAASRSDRQRTGGDGQHLPAGQRARSSGHAAMGETDDGRNKQHIAQRVAQGDMPPIPRQPTR